MKVTFNIFLFKDFKFFIKMFVETSFIMNP